MQQLGVAEQQLVAIDPSVDAMPGNGGEVHRRGQGQVPSLCTTNDGFAQGMFGAFLQRCGQRQQFVILEIAKTDDVG